MNEKSIILLGATGSVGQSVLTALKETKIPLYGFSFNHNLLKAKQIIQQYSPLVVVAFHSPHYQELKKEYPKLTLLFGLEGVDQMIGQSPSYAVVNALLGTIGLLPSITTLQLKKRLIMANKESVVAGSKFLTSLVSYPHQILPIDSEHWSLFTLMHNLKKENIQELILTASGGPFKDFSLQELKKVTPKQALKHPVWDMGKHITISSATLANKGLEVLEAKELFDFSLKQISVLVHPQSQVHGMIRLVDNSFMAHISKPCMIQPCKNALLFPFFNENPNPPSFFDNPISFQFEPVDNTRFPLLKLAYQAGKQGHASQIVYTVANQKGVDYFLNQQIAFHEIAQGVEKTLQEFSFQKIETLEEIFYIEQEAIRIAEKIFKGNKP